MTEEVGEAAQGAVEVARMAGEVASPLSVVVFVDGVQVARLGRRKSKSFDLKTGKHVVRVKAGRIWSPESEVNVATGRTPRLMCWAEPANVHEGRRTLDNWNILNLESADSDAALARSSIGRPKFPRRLLAELGALLVLGGLLLYLLVAGDTIAATIIAIPTAAFVYYVAFLRPNLAARRTRGPRS